MVNDFAYHWLATDVGFHEIIIHTTTRCSKKRNFWHFFILFFLMLESVIDTMNPTNSTTNVPNTRSLPNLKLTQNDHVLLPILQIVELRSAHLPPETGTVMVSGTCFAYFGYFEICCSNDNINVLSLLHDTGTVGCSL